MLESSAIKKKPPHKEKHQTFWDLQTADGMAKTRANIAGSYSRKKTCYQVMKLCDKT